MLGVRGSCLALSLPAAYLRWYHAPYAYERSHGRLSSAYWEHRFMKGDDGQQILSDELIEKYFIMSIHMQKKRKADKITAQEREAGRSDVAMPNVADWLSPLKIMELAQDSICNSDAPKPPSNESSVSTKPQEYLRYAAAPYAFDKAGMMYKTWRPFRFIKDHNGNRILTDEMLMELFADMENPQDEKADMEFDDDDSDDYDEIDDMVNGAGPRKRSRTDIAAFYERRREAVIERARTMVLKDTSLLTEFGMAAMLDCLSNANDATKYLALREISTARLHFVGDRLRNLLLPLREYIVTPIRQQK